ncbi:MAG: hypothetical protein ACI9OO_000098 [Bacteroidia bacterium]|jgi:hypothetical protein
MRALSPYTETYTFDAELIDSAGRKLPVDCKVGLPSIWGDKADIGLAIPHSEMPFGEFENPCELNTQFTETAFSFEMNEVSYRNLTTSIHPSRIHGAAPIKLTPILGMLVIEELAQPEIEFKIYISSPELLDNSVNWGRSERMIDELSAFQCPQLGRIELQRYWVRAGLEGVDGFLSRAGYLLKISPSSGEIKPDEVLNLVGPVLNFMSVFFRQKIIVLGWESIASGKRKRYWQYPLEPSQTTYVSVEPKQFLVSPTSLV